MSNMTDLWLSGAIFSNTPNTPKLVFGRGSAPDPAGGAYDAPPDPLVSWGDPLPIPFPSRRLRRLDLGAFGASVVRPPNTNSLRLWLQQQNVQQSQFWLDDVSWVFYNSCATSVHLKCFVGSGYDGPPAP